MKELLKKIRKYEIQIRKAVNNHMHGDFHSVFKGSGLEFDDVRSYQYGDDVRTIDWNVSAKGHGTFVKTFKEEKEQNVFFILDVSASQEIGKNTRKVDIAREICAVLALSAVKDNGSVGLICFSDQKEAYIKPDKGMRHAYQMIGTLFNLNPVSIKTDLQKSLKFTLSMLKKKSVVIFISDFIDEGYNNNLSALALKHDLVVIHLNDPREIKFPNLGIIPLYDKETKKTIWVNSSSSKFREKINKGYAENKLKLEQLCRRNGANYLWVNTNDDYLTKLVQLFKIRRMRSKR